MGGGEICLLVAFVIHGFIDRKVWCQGNALEIEKGVGRDLFIERAGFVDVILIVNSHDKTITVRTRTRGTVRTCK